MNENTTPGPDGFSVTFYKTCWDVIGKEFMGTVQEFNRGTLDITMLNYGVITLLPKVREANIIKQYRPICLPNVGFKIFSKLVVNRLTGVIENAISKNQSAFIKGRHILDTTVMLKIDFENAYDKINWIFVEEVLRIKRLDGQFTRWIMETVRGGGRVCINLNGRNGPYFNLQRLETRRPSVSCTFQLGGRCFGLNVA